jgi:hypothetical protein
MRAFPGCSSIPVPRLDRGGRRRLRHACRRHLSARSGPCRRFLYVQVYTVSAGRARTRERGVMSRCQCTRRRRQAARALVQRTSNRRDQSTILSRVPATNRLGMRGSTRPLAAGSEGTSNGPGFKSLTDQTLLPRDPVAYCTLEPQQYLEEATPSDFSQPTAQLGDTPQRPHFKKIIQETAV